MHVYQDIHSRSVQCLVLIEDFDSVGLVAVLVSVASRWDLERSCLFFLDSCGGGGGEYRRRRVRRARGGGSRTGGERGDERSRRRGQRRR
jgi:hypothetical protein